MDLPGGCIADGNALGALGNPCKLEGWHRLGRKGKEKRPGERNAIHRQKWGCWLSKMDGLFWGLRVGCNEG